MTETIERFGWDADEEPVVWHQPEQAATLAGSVSINSDTAKRVRKKIRLASLTKVGPEGYIHGYICVRPPCGQYKPVIRDKKHGSVLDGDGNALGQLRKNSDGTYSIRHKPSKTDLSGFAKPQDAVDAVGIFHNISTLRAEAIDRNPSSDAYRYLTGAHGAMATGDYDGAIGHLKTAERSTDDVQLAAHISDTRQALENLSAPVPEVPATPESKPWLATGLLTPADVRTVSPNSKTLYVVASGSGIRIGSYTADYKEDKNGNPKAYYVATYADGTQISKGSADPVRKILDYHNKQVFSTLKRKPDGPVPEKLTSIPDWSRAGAGNNFSIDPTTSSAFSFHLPSLDEWRNQQIKEEVSEATSNQGRFIPNLVAQTRVQVTSEPGKYQTSSGGSILGLHYYQKKLIQLSPQVTTAANGDAKKSVDYDNDSGWWSGADSHFSMADQVTAHEFGHGVAYKISTELPLDKQQELWLDVANGIDVTPPVLSHDYATALPEWAEKNKAAITKNVSKYGSTNSDELQAELWSEYTMKASPRPPAKAFGDFVMRNLPDRIADPQAKLDAYNNPPPLSTIDDFDPTSLKIGETKKFPRIQVTRLADRPEYAGGGPSWELKVIHQDGSLGAGQGANSPEMVRDTMRTYWNYDW